ncbi:MAG: pyridoxamine 5'-phosphate oxidase [Planctomycetota bacterium]|nr:pyridoxamine 5'-phosphate oxidase [Planctomycetota bacterium]
MGERTHPMTTDSLYLEAIEQFQQWLDDARGSTLEEPTAMTLATADLQGKPAARVVLLRNVDPRGFVFYTNSLSDKGRQLAENPRAALCFYWDPLGRQVRVEGRVEPFDDAELDEYWSLRPRENRLSAWASLQSETLNDRATLERRFAEFDAEYADQEVPRPPHWHGYRVIPDRIEFWTRRDARMHERVVYEAHPDGWTARMLYP